MGYFAKIGDYKSDDVDAADIEWPLFAPDGAAANPTYSFQSNTDCGMWLTGSTLVLSANANNVLTLTAGSATLGGNTAPNTDGAYDLGSTTRHWKDLYINGGGRIYMDADNDSWWEADSDDVISCFINSLETLEISVRKAKVLTAGTSEVSLELTNSVTDWYWQNTSTSGLMRLYDATNADIVCDISPKGGFELFNADDSAQAVLDLTQSDVDQNFFKFTGTSAGDNTQSLVDAADLTTPGAIVGWLKVEVEDLAGTGDIADGTYFMPFYATPTA